MIITYGNISFPSKFLCFSYKVLSHTFLSLPYYHKPLESVGQVLQVRVNWLLWLAEYFTCLRLNVYPVSFSLVKVGPVKYLGITGTWNCGLWNPLWSQRDGQIAP